ncbi:MAG: hypothetical protein L6R35_007594, partial [Caloplaca aegaea]
PYLFVASKRDERELHEIEQDFLRAYQANHGPPMIEEAYRKAFHHVGGLTIDERYSVVRNSKHIVKNKEKEKVRKKEEKKDVRDKEEEDLEEKEDLEAKEAQEVEGEFAGPVAIEGKGWGPVDSWAEGMLKGSSGAPREPSPAFDPDDNMGRVNPRNVRAPKGGRGDLRMGDPGKPQVAETEYAGAYSMQRRPSANQPLPELAEPTPYPIPTYLRDFMDATSWMVAEVGPHGPRMPADRRPQPIR